MCVCVHYSSLISGLNCLFTSGVDACDCKTDQNSITSGTDPVIYGAADLASMAKCDGYTNRDGKSWANGVA